jgi:hypothetical protein
VLEQGAKRVGQERLLIVDISDLIKKHGKRMEHLARVHDESERERGNGYWLCEVVRAEVCSSQIIPLAQGLWSQEGENPVSENDEILTVV